MTERAETINSSPRKCACGKMFNPEGRSLFCDECAEEAIRVYTPPENLATRKCRICGGPMYDAPEKARVCSGECRRKAAELWQKERGK